MRSNSQRVVSLNMGELASKLYLLNENRPSNLLFTFFIRFIRKQNVKNKNIEDSYKDYVIIPRAIPFPGSNNFL